MGNALRLGRLRAPALGRLIGADALRLNRGWTRGLRICLRLIGRPRRSGLGWLAMLWPDTKEKPRATNAVATSLPVFII